MNSFLIRPKVHFGSESLNYLKEIKAKSVLLVTDQKMVELGFVDEIKNRLNDAPLKIYSDIEPDPSIDTVKKGLNLFVEEKPDVVIGLGGGSPIDAAKAILLFYYQLQEKLPKEQPLFIAIPTTSGTGTEVTSYAVVTDTVQQVKIPLNDERMYPDIAILDDQLTKTVPPSVIADTGMDALTHALEAYVSLEATEFSSIFAEQAIKKIFTYLLRAYRYAEDEEARKNMQIASCLAGAAFTNASLGVNHSLAHAVGAKFQLSHGKSNAILLPYIIQYNGGLCDGTLQSSEAAIKYAEIAKILGFPSGTVEEGVISLSTAIKLLNKKFNIPLTFNACHIEKREFDQSISAVVECAFEDQCTSGNPKLVTKTDLNYLLKWAYTG